MELKLLLMHNVRWKNWKSLWLSFDSSFIDNVEWDLILKICLPLVILQLLIGLIETETVQRSTYTCVPVGVADPRVLENFAALTLPRDFSLNGVAVEAREVLGRSEELLNVDKRNNLLNCKDAEMNVRLMFMNVMIGLYCLGGKCGQLGRKFWGNTGIRRSFVF